MTGVDASDWLDFLEARLDDSKVQMQLLIGALGVLPAGVFSWLPSVMQSQLFATLIIAAVSTISIILTNWLVGLVIARRGILLLMDLVLSGLLVSPAEIGAAYHIVGSPRTSGR